MYTITTTLSLLSEMKLMLIEAGQDIDECIITFSTYNITTGSTYKKFQPPHFQIASRSLSMHYTNSIHPNEYIK